MSDLMSERIGFWFRYPTVKQCDSYKMNVFTFKWCSCVLWTELASSISEILYSKSNWNHESLFIPLHYYADRMLTCKIPSYLFMLQWECYLAGMQVPGLHVYFYRPSYFKGAGSYWHSPVPTVHLISLASKQAHCSCFFRKASKFAFPCVKELFPTHGFDILGSLTACWGPESGFYPLGFYWVSVSLSLVFLSWLGLLLNAIYMKAWS